jgi:hypothetical protein
MATFEQACRAKPDALALLAGRVDLAGIGVGGDDYQYWLTVNLHTPAAVTLPKEVNGVRLAYKYVGEIRPS